MSVTLKIDMQSIINRPQRILVKRRPYLKVKIVDGYPSQVKIFTVKLLRVQIVLDGLNISEATHCSTITQVGH